MDAVESIKQKRRSELETLQLYKVEQNFLADLMCALPRHWNEESMEQIGDKIQDVLIRHQVNQVGRVNTGILYDLFHRSGENK